MRISIMGTIQIAADGRPEMRLATVGNNFSVAYTVDDQNAVLAVLKALETAFDAKYMTMTMPHSLTPGSGSHTSAGPQPSRDNADRRA